MSESFLNGRVVLHAGDSRDVLKTIADNSIDSIVTDPPYALVSIQKRFGKPGSAPVRVGDINASNDLKAAYARASAGFMGKNWDTGETAFAVEFWAQCLRVLKPGGHVVAFSGTRTYHRMACAIEDAGFEIRDQLQWVYGSGFPKSHDVSKGIDKAAGLEREVVRERYTVKRIKPGATVEREGAWGKQDIPYTATDTAPATASALQWQGWGTALKPAIEPILFGAKPVTVAQHFAMILDEITALFEVMSWSNCNANDAENCFRAIRAKCAEAASSVLDSARRRSLESIGIAKSAAPSSTSSGRVSSDLIRTKECSALSHVALNGNEGETPDQTTRHGLAADILIRIMAISTCAMTDDISENTASLWQNISDDILNGASKFTIATVTRLTIALRTLNCSLLPSITDGTGNFSPNCEPICFGRKPLAEKTVAANVLAHGVGAINIDGCRVAANGDESGSWGNGRSDGSCWSPGRSNGGSEPEGRKHELGRWPANLLHDGSDEVLAGFPDSNSCDVARNRSVRTDKTQWRNGGADYNETTEYGDSGSAARFFYQVKPEIQIVEEVTITWISESEPCQATLLVDTGQSPQRATVVSASGDGNGWSTFLSGNTLMDLFPRASICTIRTKTSSITESRTWNYLTNFLTKEFTGDLSFETGNGGSRVESAGSEVGCLIFTLAKTAYLPGANLAASETRLKISVSAKHLAQPSESKRFWYSSKAGADDRLGSSHPTVKPVDLLQYLCRLITPPGGTVLDMFAGTGTTGEAAYREGFNCILIERELEYQEDIRRRMALVLSGPDERARESIKARLKDAVPDHGPLFGGLDPIAEAAE